MTVFYDAAAVAVVGVFDHGAVFGLGADQLVPDVVGVVLDEDRYAGDAGGVGGACGGPLVAVVIVGVVCDFRQDRGLGGV